MIVKAPVEQLDFMAPPLVRVWHRRSLLAGGLLAVLSIVGAVLSPAQAMHSYLLGFMLILGLALGSMGMLMTWHLTGGEWGVGIRRILEAATATLPLVALGFIPIVLGVRVNYPWAQPDVLQHSEHIRHLAGQYFKFSSFVLRGIMYFAGWGVLAFYLLRWSSEQDRPFARELGPRFRGLSGAGMLIYFWAITFATVDWVMSAALPWYSTIYALIFAVGQGTIAMAFAVVIARALLGHGAMREVLHSRSFHDYGKLLLMFVMIWGWFSYSQWLLIWSGNLPEEIKFYLDRTHGGWEYVAFALIIGHFAIPFALLLSRGLKQDPNRLVWVAVWLLLVRYLDLYWNIEPNYSPRRFHFSWMDAVIPLAMAGLWASVFFRNLGRRPLVALYDPHLRAVLSKHE